MGNPPKGISKGKAPAIPTSPASVTIPHDPKRTYADRIISYATDYYFYSGTVCAQANWKELKGRQNGENVLVEVWEDPNERDGILIHPSRNRFYWVAADLGQKKHWQRKVVGCLNAIMVGRKRGLVPHETALDALQMKPRLPKTNPDPIRHPKDEMRPSWATEQNLIGYTSEGRITWGTTNNILAGLRRAWLRSKIPQGIELDEDLVPTMQNLNLHWLPSVYYTQGHLTTDHGRRQNIGWRSEVGACLFFGNVLKAYVY